MARTSSTGGGSGGSKPASPGSSHLGAFKQLGFDFTSDNNHASSANDGGRKTPSFIPYSISSFSNSNSRTGLDIEESRSEKFQQIKHPNDILTNMGLKLPSEQILGQSRIRAE